MSHKMQFVDIETVIILGCKRRSKNLSFNVVFKTVNVS